MAERPRPDEPIAAAALCRVRVVDVAGRSDWQSPLYVALAPLAFLRPGSRRLALALWGYVGLPLPDVVALDPPARPVLAADLACRWPCSAGLGADWIRSRAWSILLGFDPGLALFDELDLLLDRPGRPERVDRRPPFFASGRSRAC